MHAHKFFKRSLLSLALLSCVYMTTQAQAIGDLQQIQQAKLETAIQQLNEQRKNIQREKIPLAQKLRTLELEASQLREALSEARKVKDRRSVDLETLRQSVVSQQQAYNTITRTLFGEYKSTYESSLSAGELLNYGKSIRALNLKLETPDLGEAEQLQSILNCILESTERIESTIGGKSYSGEALDSEGRLVAGTFVQVGPLLYFSNDSTAGVIEESNTFQALVRSIDSQADKAIRNVAANAVGELPVDSSLGNALAMQGTKDSILVHIRKGGIWVYPIILFAFVATIIAIFKSVQIIKIRQPAPQSVHGIVKLLRDGKQAEALQLAQQQPRPARDIFIQAVQHADEPIELVEEAMYESMLNTQPVLERYLNIIAVTASVAPLLGLLGTVTGIIKTFNLMRVFGAGDPKPLISGISEALITTELGLVLAIPALLVHALLARKVAGVMAHCEKLSVAFINGLSRSEKSN